MDFGIRRSAAGLLLLMMLLVLAPAHAAAELPKIEDYTDGMESLEGFLPLYWDAAAGRLYLEIPASGTEALFFTTLAQGIGSNDIGLDRGQVAAARLVRFERVGSKLLLMQPNLDYRADTGDAAARLAATQSFASSVLYGFTLSAASGARLLVDATDFVVRDGHGAIARLKRVQQGSFKLDPTRSVVDRAGTKAFERNVELQALLTLVSDEPGDYVKDVAPTPQAVSIRERYSFVELPPPGFEPRESLPGDGYSEMSYRNMAAPLDQSQTVRLITRHRLQKKDPAAALSEAVEPIVYYIDRGAPPPIREALLRGASWWNQAFEAAGYRDAFRVELLPEGADPLDARYNIIQWVHRATRGWSYGARIVDPRTGEIVKGNVTLGSLRARYDYLIAEGLLSPYGGDGKSTDAMQQLVLARLSQLAAHELGHTLGLSHNYLASTAKRASVMDYPVPLVKLTDDGHIDLSEAYAVGIGAWDKVSIAYGYQDFPDGTDEDQALRGILSEARARGLEFMTDQDARPAGAANPQVNLWDNGTDMVAELRHVMAVRRAALSRFGEGAIQAGAPLATIEDALVPLYLYHRYQVEATAKSLGGIDYRYALRGDGQRAWSRVPAAQQRKALDALVDTLAPDELALPESLLSLIPPRPPGYPPTRELFPRYTGLVFDRLSPAVTASRLVMSALLQEERAARLVEQHAADSGLPGLGEVIDRLVDASFGTNTKTAYARQILQAQQILLVERLLSLAQSAPMPQVRALALLHLQALQARLTRAKGGEDSEQAQRLILLDTLRRFADRPYAPHALEAPEGPPGSPLGD